jgi:hypothetical protein
VSGAASVTVSAIVALPLLAAMPAGGSVADRVTDVPVMSSAVMSLAATRLPFRMMLLSSE